MSKQAKDLGDGRAVILADRLPETYADLYEPYRFVDWPALEDEAIRAAVEGIVAYGHPRIDGRLMDRLPRLRVISNHGVGVDHIDVRAAAERGIAVGNTPGCLDDATADMTWALLLAVARNVVVGDRYARSPAFVAYDPSLWIGREVTGATLGIVGMGRIGTEVARRARGFRMRILYHNRRRNRAAEQTLGAEYVTLDGLLSASDFVTLNCPLTPQTRGMIGARQLALMKPSAVLINVARGGVVDTEALYTALRERRIAAAALDVTEPEPLPRDHPLLELENVIITPHLGSASDRTRRRMMEMTFENLAAGLRGDALPYPVVAGSP